MVVETFGDMLYYPDSESSKEFPSPESLKRRIIISTKPPKEYLQAKNGKENNGDTQNVTENEEGAWGKEVPDLQAALDKVSILVIVSLFIITLSMVIQIQVDHTENNQTEEDDDDKLDDDDDDDDEDTDDEGGKNTRKNLPREYKRIITIRAGKPKGHISEALKDDPNQVRRLSLSEQELAKAAASHGADIIR